MAIQASLKRRTPTVGIKLSNTGSIQTSTGVTVQSTLTGNRLDTLQDVNASAETDGATLVYNASTDTYEVKKLSTSDITGNLDGGTF